MGNPALCAGIAALLPVACLLALLVYLFFWLALFIILPSCFSALQPFLRVLVLCNDRVTQFVRPAVLPVGGPGVQLDLF